MVRAILLDCGGVMVAPATEHWMLPPGYEEILGANFAKEHLPAFRMAAGLQVHLLPEANRVETETEECAMIVEFYRVTLEAINITLSEPALLRLAQWQTVKSDRYTLFSDVLEGIRRWQGKYRLGILSNAPPSTRRIMEELGVMDLLDGATFSFELGIMKPDRRIYEYALAQMGVSPPEAVFLEDTPAMLEGALAVGLPCIQMRRPMPPGYHVPEAWHGPLAHTFQEADRVLSTLKGAS